MSWVSLGLCSFTEKEAEARGTLVLWLVYDGLKLAGWWPEHPFCSGVYCLWDLRQSSSGPAPAKRGQVVASAS